MPHHLTLSRFIDEYPHVTLALSGFFGAVLLLFFLWFTLFLGLPPAHAIAGMSTVDDCSRYPLRGATTAVLKNNVANSGVFYFDPASVPENPAQKVYLPPVTKRTCAVKVAGSTNFQLKGWAWNDNFGWASFYCPGPGGNNLGAYCGDKKYGVILDDEGNFSGYAWSNAGWIRFSCDAIHDLGDAEHCAVSNYGVALDLQKIDSYGYAPVKLSAAAALSANVGWLNFTGVRVPFAASPLIIEDADGDGIITDGDIDAVNPDINALQLTGNIGQKSALKLTWNDPNYDAQAVYHVYRSKAPMPSRKGDGVDGLTELLPTNAAGKVTYDDTVPEINTDFYYLVTTLDANQKIVKISNNFKVNIVVTGGIIDPVPPLDVNAIHLTGASGPKNALTLSWNDPQFDAKTLYHIYRSPTLITSKKGEKTPAALEVANIQGKINEQIVPANDRDFYYLVATLDSKKNILKISNNFMVNIHAGNDAIPPVDPARIHLTSHSGQNSALKLTWNDKAYTNSTVYHIYRSQDPIIAQKGDGVSDLENAGQVQGKNTSDQIVPATNKDFYYLVATLDSKKKILKISNVIVAHITVEKRSIPLPPLAAGMIALDGEIGQGSALKLTWKDPAYDAVAVYHVYRSQAQIPSQKGDGISGLTELLPTNPPGKVAYEETVPENNKEYFYLVATLDNKQKMTKISNNFVVKITVNGNNSGGGNSGGGSNPPGSGGCTGDSCDVGSCIPDADGDGFCPNSPPPSKDCKDTDPFINPASPDVCSNICNDEEIPASCSEDTSSKPVLPSDADYTFNVPYTVGNSHALGNGTVSLGSALRADIRNIIFKNVQQLKRGASTQCGSLGNILNFQPQDDVYYCKGDITIGPVAPWTGRKTLIIEDGNIHIRGDIFPDDMDAQLGLIVLRTNLKDSTKANVYISPEVHSLRLQLFADGSLFSAIEDSNTGKVKKLAASAVPEILDGDYSSSSGKLFGQLFLQGLFVTHNTVDMEPYFDEAQLNKKYPDAFGKHIIADPNIGKLYSLSFLRSVPKKTVCKDQDGKDQSAKFSSGINSCAQSWKIFSDEYKEKEQKPFPNISSKLQNQNEIIANKAHSIVIFYEPPASDLPGFTNFGATNAVQR